MQKILEVLKKEGGQIKISRLSHKKILLKYSVDIVCFGVKVGEVKINSRYSYNQRCDSYEINPQKTGFFGKISNKFGVKMKFISTSYIMSFDNIVNIDGVECKLNRLVHQISISDKDWYTQWNRDKNIREVLNSKEKEYV